MREEVAAVLATWPSSNAPDEEERAVRSTLLNLLGYPHRRGAAWHAYLLATPQEVAAVFERWRAPCRLEQ
jgi:hypothetical protein